MIKRAAFSLIELVLAIVIIAISLMTIPLMLSQSTNNDSVSIMQESILATRTKMGNILSYQWDACSTIEEGVAGAETRLKVLDVINGDLELNRTIVENRRIGHLPIDTRRRFHAVTLNNPVGPIRPLALGSEVNKTNISGFDGNITQMLAVNNSTGFDYIRDFNITTNVSYVSDDTNYSRQRVNFDFNVSSSASITNVNLSTNIKMIEMNVQSAGVTPFTLRAFSSNIGQSTLFSLPY